ncbi:type IV pilus biogenesis/stability protein PilW [Noviherbaspirillum sp. 1P10PC]|uniref:type IV pilus biogenesis/stability protein PilW n=1 Tax=Noviherbaspirillum sp. 1P10PC TaxID=3132292 RepID=UPI0039A19973
MKAGLDGWSGVAFSLLLLGACAGVGQAPAPQDLRTSVDQTDIERRAQIRLQLAVGYYGQGQLATALDEIKQAIQINPALADAYSVRALIYMDMHETQLAEDSFQRAMKLAPGNPDFANNYGWFLCENGRATESLAYFESALKNRSYTSPAKALNNAGVCSLRLKDAAAAERYFNQAFQADPGNPDANLNLARLYYDRGDYQRARFYVSRLLRAEQSNAAALWMAIRVERKLGDRDAESSLSNQLRRRFPDSREYAALTRGAYDE